MCIRKTIEMCKALENSLKLMAYEHFPSTWVKREAKKVPEIDAKQRTTIEVLMDTITKRSHGAK